jgi:hypothetical protein
MECNGSKMNELFERILRESEVDEADLYDFIRDRVEAGKFERRDFEQIKDYLQDNDAAGTQQ